MFSRYSRGSGVPMPIRIALLFVLLSASNAYAQLCGLDVEHSTKKVSGKAAIELTPPTDKALLYVLTPTYAAGFIQMKASIDREWVGVNQYKSYFVVAVTPGTHDLCSKSGDNTSHLELTVEAGKTYYVRQDTVAKGGIGRPPSSLSLLPAEEGVFFLQKCKRIIFWQKGQPKPATD